MAVVGLLALLSLVVDFGFDTSERMDVLLGRLDVVLATCFAVELLASAILRRGAALRARWYEYLLFVLFVGSLEALHWMGGAHREFLTRYHVGSLTKTYLALLQFYIFASLLLHFLRSHARLLDRRIHPQVLLTAGFGLLVLAGTGLLMLPRCGTHGAVGALDALFTATSAVCVTGLSVLDTGADFTPQGQAVIAGLFQVGGLGIIAFVAFASILSGSRFSLPQMLALRNVLNAPNLGEVRRHVVITVFTMFLIETIGAALLFFSGAPPTSGILARAGWSVFHSISAFCNAGFALQGDSLEGFRSGWGVNLTIMGLIILGGLGTPVLRNVGRVCAGMARRLVQGGRRRGPAGRPVARLTLQSKLTLGATAALLVGGFLIMLGLEWSHTLAGMPVHEKMLASMFQSVTTRTAGFNTVPIGDLQDASQVSFIGLMVIGASPVSTGGGIKTVTFCILLLTLRMHMTGRSQAQLLGASIAPRMVHAAVSVFVLYVLTAFLVVLVLCITDPALPLQGQIFEAVSALSTVGLTTGITAKLSVGGRLIVCLAMFVGRLGPLTIVLSIFQSSGSSVSYQYPEEPLLLG